MSYSDHKKLVKTFLDNRKMKNSIRSYFNEFLRDDLGKSDYGAKQVVDAVFYIGDPTSNRYQLSDFDSTDSDSYSHLKGVADDKQTINLLNDYISRLDLRREANRMKLKTLLIIFMLRSFRNNYYKLNVNLDYAKILKDIVDGILKAQTTILTYARRDLRLIDEGVDVAIPRMNNDPDWFIKTFMKSDVPYDPELLLGDLEDEELIIDVKDDLEQTLATLGIHLLSVRTDRVITKVIFPFFTSDQRKLSREVIKYYKTLFQKCTPNITANILFKLVGISSHAYSKYKPIVASELIQLSNENSYEDITAYLLDSN